MNNFKFLFFLLGIVVFISACGDDDDEGCTQSDWVGEYTIVGDRECEDGGTTLVFNETIEILSGSMSNTINWDGDDVVFTDCTVSEIVVLTLNDNNTITSRIGNNCSKEYTRI